MKSAEVSLRRDETLREGLLQCFGHLTDSIVNQSWSAQTDEQRTHRIHTMIKRLRSLLRLIRPGVDAAFFNQENKRLRNAARILSSAHDSEVARNTLKTLPVNDHPGREAVEVALSGLEPRIQRVPFRCMHGENMTRAFWTSLTYLLTKT
jgi:CHAD domain-containing protein